MTTIKSDTSPVQAVMFAVTGGTFRLQLTNDEGPGHRSGYILDDDGNRIGDASDFIYGGRGFAVHTKPFAGFVSIDQIEFVGTPS